MMFQRCQYEGKIMTVPVRCINKGQYLFVQDVHDHFIGVRRFTLNEKLIPFVQDNNNNPIYPQRISASIGDVIDCHTSTSANEEELPGRNLFREILENTEILKKRVDALQRETFELTEYTVPHLFIVLPEETFSYNPSNLFCHKYRLHFLCECENENERHLALHNGYEISKPREFFRKYAPYIRKTLTVIKGVACVGSIVVPQLSSINKGLSNSTILQKEFWNNIADKAERADAILTKVQESLNISTETMIQEVDGAELRQIQSYLKKVDQHDKLGNLYRYITSAGHVRWVCIKHCNRQCSNDKIQQLQNKFQDLGGKISDDVALVHELSESKFSKVLGLLNQGLTISTISMKNLKLGEKSFSKFLDIISNKNKIDKLQLENISVTSRLMIKYMATRDIISKLDQTVKNSELIIEYTITRPFIKFHPELFKTIKVTNPRLIFKVRSEEEVKPSLELTGTNHTGFLLSIKSNNKTDSIMYFSAINNIFQNLDISILHLHDKVLSENLWNIVHLFVPEEKNLKEMIINCPLTLNETQKWIAPIHLNENLKTLHITNRSRETSVCTKIFEILKNSKTLEKFSLTSSTYDLRFDFMTEWCAYQGSDIEIIKNFLRIIPVHHLSLDLTDNNCETSFEQFAKTINQVSSLKTLELQSKTSYAVFHRGKRVFNKKISVREPELLYVQKSKSQKSKPSRRKKLKNYLSFLSCVSPKYYRSSQKESRDPLEILEAREDRRVMSVESFSQIYLLPLYKQMQEIALDFTLKKLRVTFGPNVNISHIVSSIKAKSTVTHLGFAGRIGETDITKLIKAFRKNETISHLCLKDMEISLSNLRRIFDVSYDNPTLNELEILNCTSDSNSKLFQQEIERVRSENRNLKFSFENHKFQLH